MVSKQSVVAESQKTAPKNQDWMKDFLAESGPEESESKAHGDENFAELFEASQQQQEIKEGEVVDGTVVAVTPEYATIDIGYKCEGLVPLQEFKDAQGVAHVAVGDVVRVYLDRMGVENGFM